MLGTVVSSQEVLCGSVHTKGGDFLLIVFVFVGNRVISMCIFALILDFMAAMLRYLLSMSQAVAHILQLFPHSQQSIPPNPRSLAASATKTLSR
jgi:hypothetical protein